LSRSERLSKAERMLSKNASLGTHSQQAIIEGNDVVNSSLGRKRVPFRFEDWFRVDM
jgi:hypothetical protein